MDKSKISELAPKQLERVLSFFTRVEAKASFIFAINSALLGTLVLHVERSDFADWRRYIALGAAAVGLATSFYYVYRCSFPALSGGHQSLIYFKEIAKLREQTFVKSFRDLEEDDYVNDLLSQTWRNSQILTEKFRTIKIAFIATALTLLPWSTYLALASMSHLSLPLH
ncbi:Pycsar system effector family protein [Bradyrhizobium sp. SZCCHNR1039]|uniref:Pycsar system effector family protein n=1 Tax=Bradyrhizobium sp. SZCCHNR1039 TaxID=3057350 RepID=UPI002916AE2C|nr:Pycsar system effector family protein [Bradyrhizobium sp. SZCCHNR1039]